MRHRLSFIATAILFIIINTTRFWEAYTGIWSVFSFIAIIILFLLLCIILGIHITLLAKERFTNKHRLILVSFMTLVLTLTYIFPNGLVPYEWLEKDSLLIANREGAANCTTTLKLYSDKRFMERVVCFEVNKTEGTYRQHKDTVYFYKELSRDSTPYYMFAVIDTKETYNYKLLRLYKSYNDTIPLDLYISKNKLKQ